VDACLLRTLFVKELPATDRSLVQRSPTDCGAPLSVIRRNSRLYSQNSVLFAIKLTETCTLFPVTKGLMSSNSVIRIYGDGISFQQCLYFTKFTGNIKSV
jgi:hypothetical protein